MKKFKPKKIFIFTTNRSDFGLLKRFIALSKKSICFDPTLIITGSHLEKKFGYTFNEIKKDKLIKFKKVSLKILDGTPINYNFAIANGFKKFSRIYSKEKPDLIVVLGDRIELIPICYSAILFNIPIAHFNGGELTEGAIDNSIRHSVSKLSHIHFVANKIYKKRLIKMGEETTKVFNVGGTSVDNIKNIKFVSEKFLEKKFKIKFKSKNFLVTYHPVTLDLKNSILEIDNLLGVLKKYKDYGIIFTGTNSDPYNNIIRTKIKNFCKNNSNSVYIESMGHSNYLSMMKLSNAVIGNSSSGILEAPYLKKPVVNIGNRQKGREKSKNIIDCKSNYKSIYQPIKKVDSLAFLKSLKNTENYYGDGTASKKALKILKNLKLKNLIIKKFNDID